MWHVVYKCLLGFITSMVFCRSHFLSISLSDISATAFYKAQPILDFALEYLNIRDTSRRLSDQDRIKVLNIILLLYPHLVLMLYGLIVSYFAVSLCS